MATAKDVCHRYVAAYLDGFPGVEAGLHIIHTCEEVFGSDVIKDLLMTSLDGSEDTRQATICFFAQLREVQPLCSAEVAKAFEELSDELDLEDLRLDIPDVDSYLYVMVSQAERFGLVPLKKSLASIPTKHTSLCNEIADASIEAAVLLLLSLLDSSSLDIGESARDLQRFTIFGAIPRAVRDVFLERALVHAVGDRAAGAIVGMAVGDALGQPLEFVPAGKSGHSFDPKTLQYTGIYNSQNLKPGQWTDDASMGLCIADSLLVKKSYDGSDIRIRFWNWWFRGYDNAFRKELARSGSVGLGGNIANSFQEIRNLAPHAPPPRYTAEGSDSGNGSLMRLAPVPIFFHRDLAAAVNHSRESSYTTHPGEVAAELCGFLGYVIAKAVAGSRYPQTAAEFLDSCIQAFIEEFELERSSDVLARLLRSNEPSKSTEICWNWRDPAGPFIEDAVKLRGGSYNGYAFSAEYFGSYAPDGLALALHCVYHTGDFTEAVARCVNLLGDADSNASITGQIAGAFYGYHQIDARCLSNLERWDDREVALRGALLCFMNHGP